MKHLIVLLLAFLVSCENSSNTNRLVDITSKIDKTSGILDLTLSITNNNATDSTMNYTAIGLYKTDTVGMEVSLKKGIKLGMVGGEMKNPFIKNGIKFRSIGAKSDKLLSAISELYGIHSSDLIMKDEVTVLVTANLNRQDVNFDNGKYRFKIFMETEGGISELFVNFDFTNKHIFLNEKDMEYRKGVIEYLTKTK